MRTLLVTSEVTYVPSNYLSLFEEVMDRAEKHVAGLVILRNLSPSLVATAAGLAFMGCPRVAASMVANMAMLPLRRRERLFTKRHLPVLKPRSMNEPWVAEWVRKYDIDLIVNLRTRCIYKNGILEAPRLGCLNIHHGLLPEYRGTLCDLYALEQGRPAGFTIHVMNEKIDAGQILHCEQVSREGEKNYIDYLRRTGIEEGRALAALLHEIAAKGRLPGGRPNVCERPVFTRNPSRSRIAEMRKEGIVL